MKESLKQLINYITKFEKSELDTIAVCFQPQSVKRNTLLLHAGEVCREFYFVHKGCIRTYFLDRKGTEKTRLVMTDFSIGTALTSFISQKPSFEFVEALDDSEILAISHENFYRINQEIDHWKVFYQRILEMAYSFQNRKIEGLVTLTAKQRYDQLLKESPHLVQRLSNRVLASYLDIEPETLSRLKSK